MELSSACFQHGLHSQPPWLLLLAAVGFVSSVRATFAFLRWTFVTFLRPAKNLQAYGSWAVITGATDGIGRSLAFQFARVGLKLVLVGRNLDKLRAVSDGIRAKHPQAKVETVVVDLAGDLIQGVEMLRKAIQGLDVGVLVNNAGLSYPYGRYFHEVDEGLMRDLLRVNVEAVTRVTHAVLPGMLEKKKGAIVNIGSGSATVVPSEPLYSVYAGTKAFIDQFSRCLYVEYKSKGIDVQCQVPLYVATKMPSIRNATFLAPSSDAYARASLRWIGYEPRCSPYWPHSILWFFVSMVPETLFDHWRLGFLLDVRRRGQLKDSRKKDK